MFIHFLETITLRITSQNMPELRMPFGLKETIFRLASFEEDQYAQDIHKKTASCHIKSFYHKYHHRINISYLAGC